MLNHVRFYGPIYEPCCGDGAMSEVLIGAGYNVISSDIVDRGYGQVADFLDKPGQFENVVTNPPFNVAAELLEHALQLTTGKVCFLLRTAFLESSSRYYQFFRSEPPDTVLIFSERLSMFPAGHSATTGGTTSYSWFIWDTEKQFGKTEIHWIPPGLKPNSRAVRTL